MHAPVSHEVNGTHAGHPTPHTPRARLAITAPLRPRRGVAPLPGWSPLHFHAAPVHFAETWAWPYTPELEIAAAGGDPSQLDQM